MKLKLPMSYLGINAYDSLYKIKATMVWRISNISDDILTPS